MAKKHYVDIDMQSAVKVTNLPTPTAGGDAVNKTYADLKVPGGGVYFSAGYYLTPAGSRTTIQMAANTEYAVPIWLLNTATIVRIGLEITIAGTAGTVIRLGIRSDNGTGQPGTLRVDAGTVDGATISTGIELTISHAITAPGVYWLTATAQSTGATLPTVRAATGSITPSGVGSLAGALSGTTPTGFVTAATVTGALGSSYTVANRTGAPPVVAIRA